MNAVKEDVEKLIEKELESVNKKFPPFNTAHEGYAILKEELEETEEQLDFAKVMFDVMWINIKENCIQTSIENANELEQYAINVAIEAIQVAAMGQKFIDSIGGTE